MLSTIKRFGGRLTGGSDLSQEDYLRSYYAQYGVNYPSTGNASISVENQSYRGIFADKDPQPTDLEKEDERLWIKQLGLLATLTLAPFVLKNWMPDALKTLSWVGASAAALSFAASEGGSATAERRKQIHNVRTARAATERKKFEYSEVVSNAVINYGAYNQILKVGSHLPLEQRVKLLQDHGILDLAPPSWFPEPAIKTVQARVVGQSLGVHSLKPEGFAEADPVEDIGKIYDNTIRKNILWLGGMGDSKTVSSHFGLMRWMKAASDPTQPKIKPLIVMIFDPHQGTNDDPNYASHWHGLPVLDKMPQFIQSCVFKGDGAELLPFLTLFDKELTARKNGAALDFDILVICEEFGSTARNTDDKVMEDISKILGKLGTESRKFGLHYWLIAHSCTQKELKVDRTTLRNCVAAVGYGILTDSSQVANLPQQLVSEGVSEVIARKTGGQKYAGLATSMFEAPYLPPAPLNTVEMRDSFAPPAPATTEAKEVALEVDEEKVKFAIALKAIRSWWNGQSADPDNAALIQAWCQLTGESPEQIGSNVGDLRKLMLLSESKFSQYVQHMVGN